MFPVKPTLTVGGETVIQPEKKKKKKRQGIKQASTKQHNSLVEVSTA